VRYRHFGRQFCSNTRRNRCKQRYLANHPDKLSVRMGIMGSIVVNVFRKMLSECCSISSYNAAIVAQLASVRSLRRTVEPVAR
jgi:hypothetical protein